MDYTQAGVDVEREAEVSKAFYEVAKKTFDLRKGTIGEIIIPCDDFAGVRVIDVGQLPPGSVMCLGFDGVGTKAEIAQRMNDHSTIAFDLLAMVCDDAIVRGAEPVLMGSVLDTCALPDLAAMKQLTTGYLAAAKEANVAIINGEIAQLGDAVGGYGKNKYNWCASLVWFAKKEKLFTGQEIKKGDSVVLFSETGFRSNGLSLVRKAFENEYGSDWHTVAFGDTVLGTAVLQPSKIYSRALVHMHGGFNTDGCCEIHGVSHITGGGIPEKLGRMLHPSGLGVFLDNVFTPCDAMLHCQEVGSVSDEDAYNTWNMGQGLAVITPEPEKVISEAKKFGIVACVGGVVTAEQGITLVSKGFNKSGQELKW